jgi:peptidyl-prolyl cis-trans isomerase B (cyclophilin B)
MKGLLTALVFSIGFVNADVIQGTTPLQAPAPKEQQNVQIIIDTNLGTITAELYPAKAPATVSNMLAYIDAKFYEHTIFHRVIDGFMIQGGGFTRDMIQKKTNPPIKNEADNGLRNERGTLAMARTMIVDSASSQFFVNLVDNAYLDFKNKSDQGWGYCVFGKVIDGMDVVDKIAKVKTDFSGRYPNVPVEPVIINSISRKTDIATEPAK